MVPAKEQKPCDAEIARAILSNYKNGGIVKHMAQKYATKGGPLHVKFKCPMNIVSHETVLARTCPSDRLSNGNACAL